MDNDSNTVYQRTFTKTFIGLYKLVNTWQHVNLQFREINQLQSMAQNPNSESTPEEITEIIISIHENPYKFSELNSSAECSQCKKIYKFDQKKTGNKTLSKHYRKIQKHLVEECSRKRSLIVW